MARLHLDHIIPLAPGGSDDEANPRLACPIRNGHKSDKAAAIALFNPRTQAWTEHFCWEDRGLRVSGLTAIGRTTVAALHLDEDPDALGVRRYWIHAGWHPPRDERCRSTVLLGCGMEARHFGIVFSGGNGASVFQFGSSGNS
jgi:hypothetical protein